MNKVILVDGNALMYRAFYATNFGDVLKTSKGIYTNALYGFINLIEAIILQEQPTYFLVAFDAAKKTFRHDLATDYKAGRRKTPEELLTQIPLIKEYLDLKGIPRYEQEGIEADDIIGTSAKNFSDLGFLVSIYSSDNDLLQLVSENITVNLTKKGVSNLDTYNIENFYSKKQMLPKQIVDYKAIAGDTSDNLKGIRRFGNVKALKVLAEYNDLETLYNNIDKFSRADQESLLESRDNAFLCKQLATILTDATLNITLQDYIIKPADNLNLINFYRKYEFASFLKKLNTPSSSDSPNFRLITTEEEFKSILDIESYLYIEHIDFNYHRLPIIAISYIAKNSNDLFILDLNLLNTLTFKEYIESTSYIKYTYDLKRLIVSLNKYELEPKGFTFDLMLGLYLLNPDLDTSSFPSAISYFSHSLINLDEEVYGKGAKREVPNNTVLYNHVVKKASLIREYKDIVLKELETTNQLELLNDIELPLTFVLADMESSGISVSKEELAKQTNHITKLIYEIDEEIYKITGKFNLNSPKQLSDVLFNKLGLRYFHGSKISTSMSVLESIRSQHPIIDLIIEHRKYTKLLTSYLQNLESNIFPDNKIHTIFQQTLTRTGRLSSVEPNLQNIPSRNYFQKELRKVFVAGNNTIFYSCDYSQIELRVLTEIAHVKNFEYAFNNNLDVHKETAMKIFKKQEISDLERQKAKACNFGIIYGIGPYGLASDLKIPVYEATDFINSYFELNPEIKRYQENILSYVKQNGYVKSLFNRRRYINLDSGSFFERENSKRIAINTPIQSSAADIIKIAMIKIYQKFKELNLKSKLIVQIHDELLFEVYEEELRIVQQIVNSEMLNIKGFKTKLDLSEAFGKDLYSL